ncbi:MAG: hypothetical protein ACLFPE_00900 [Bacteroidales bacterium]
MKKKKFVPQAQQHQDYIILEISATLEDYRMAFELNRMPQLQLQRGEDLLVYGGTKTPPDSYSLYFFQAENTTYYLIHNLANDFTLMKSYFLIMEGHADEQWQQNLADHLEQTGDVLAVNFVDPCQSIDGKGSSKKKLQLVTAILTDLEYHMLEVKKKSEEQKVQPKQGLKTNVRKLYD